MDKRFWICGIVVSIAAMLLDTVIHAWLLQGDYAPLVATGAMRGPADAPHYLPWLLGAHLLIGFGLTWLYRNGADPMHSTAAQGLRFGAAFAIAATIPGFLIYYAVQPLPGILVAKQVALSAAAMLLLGLLLAWLNPGRRAL